MKNILLLSLFSTFIYSSTPSEEIINNYVSAINEARSETRSCGSYGTFEAANPIRWSNKLYKASKAHSIDMATNGQMTHTGSGKKTDIASGFFSQSTVGDRVKYFDYKFKGIAENIGAGQKSYKDVVDAWMKSPGHCKNIMNPLYTEIGMSKEINNNAKYKIFWTLNLGAQL